MLTRQGRTVLVASLSLIVSGRLLGVSELHLSGAAGATLVVAAAIWVRLLQVKIDVVRTIKPKRVHAGSSVTIELEVTNRGRRATPALQLHDFVSNLGTTSLTVPPLQPGEATRTHYVVRCEQRGITIVGPLKIAASDPFDLISLIVHESITNELVIWPAIADIGSPRLVGSGNDGAHPSSTPPSFSGSDLVGLRPYQAGDDLRHVHWRASARYDDLIVRQLENPPDNLTTIILDTRASTHTHTSFERAVAATASILVACAKNETQLRLLITSSQTASNQVTPNPGTVNLFDSGTNTGLRFVESLLDELALIQPNPTATLPTILSNIQTGLDKHSQNNNMIQSILVLGGDTNDLTPLTNGLGGLASEVTGFAFVNGRYNQTSLNPNIVIVNETTTFEEAWSTSMGRRT